MPAVISIFGIELFSLNSCLATNIPLPSVGGSSDLDPWDICSADASKSNAENPLPAVGGSLPATGGSLPATGGPKKTDPINADLDRISGYLGKNNSVEAQNIPSYEYKTLKEFKTLYFPDRLTKQEMKIMLKVFRFVFGDTSSTVDRSVLLQLLTPFDRTPCKGEGQDKVWQLFHDCLQYRITGASDLSAPVDTTPQFTYGEDTYVVTIEANEPQKREVFLQAIDPKMLTVKGDSKQLFSMFECIKAEDKILKVDGKEVKSTELPRADQGDKHIYLLVRKNKLKKPTKKSPGLNRELALLAKTNPKINKEYEDKRTLKAQLYRMISMLKEPRRSCVVFSDKGGEFHLSGYHTAILDLIRKTVTGFLQDKVPSTEEEKQKHFELLLTELKNLKEEKGDNKATYNQMLEVVKTVFDKLKVVDTNLDKVGTLPVGGKDDPAVVAKLKGIDGGLTKLDELLREISPSMGGKDPQRGGGSEEDSAEAQEEYDRVYTTALGHLDEVSKSAKEELLEEVLEILGLRGKGSGGKDLESAIEHAVSRKGFSLQATVSRLDDITVNKHAKSFLRCVETLLEIKEGQHEAYERPSLSAGEERYSSIMTKYPFLKQYIPATIFRQKEFKDLPTLRRIYPYTDMVIEDIHRMRKQPDPVCLFYSGNLMKSAKSAKSTRKACKKIVDLIPQCEHLLEEVLTILSKENLPALRAGLEFREISLPTGFSSLAEAIRENLPQTPSLPITIHERPPPTFEKVMGDRPFLLLGTGTVLPLPAVGGHGIKDMEIDVSDDIDEIRKGEISLGSLMLVYLYIKCDSGVDA